MIEKVVTPRDLAEHFPNTLIGFIERLPSQVVYQEAKDSASKVRERASRARLIRALSREQIVGVALFASIALEWKACYIEPVPQAGV